MSACSVGADPWTAGGWGACCGIGAGGGADAGAGVPAGACSEVGDLGTDSRGAPQLTVTTIASNPAHERNETGFLMDGLHHATYPLQPSPESSPPHPNIRAHALSLARP